MSDQGQALPYTGDELSEVIAWLDKWAGAFVGFAPEWGSDNRFARLAATLRALSSPGEPTEPTPEIQGTLDRLGRIIYALDKRTLPDLEVVAGLHHVHQSLCRQFGPREKNDV